MVGKHTRRVYTFDVNGEKRDVVFESIVCGVLPQFVTEETAKVEARRLFGDETSATLLSARDEVSEINVDVV